MTVENFPPAVDSLSQTQSNELQTPSFSPLYKQIKELILQSLRQGEYKPGEIIPSEIELASRFKVSQGTVRKAVDELALENLLTRKQGRGTFVATHTKEQIQYRFLRLLPDDSEKETPAQRLIIECKSVKAPQDVASLLSLEAGQSVIYVKRLLKFAQSPAILENIWLNGAAFEKLNSKLLAAYQGSMYALFESEFSVHMVRADEKIRAVQADDEAAKLLAISPNTPLLSVERLAYTYNDVPMELRRGLYRTDTRHYFNQLN